MQELQLTDKEIALILDAVDSYITRAETTDCEYIHEKAKALAKVYTTIQAQLN